MDELLVLQTFDIGGPILVLGLCATVSFKFAFCFTLCPTPVYYSSNTSVSLHLSWRAACLIVIVPWIQVFHPFIIKCLISGQFVMAILLAVAKPSGNGVEKCEQNRTFKQLILQQSWGVAIMSDLTRFLLLCLHYQLSVHDMWRGDTREWAVFAKSCKSQKKFALSHLWFSSSAENI